MLWSHCVLCILKVEICSHREGKNKTNSLPKKSYVYVTVIVNRREPNDIEKATLLALIHKPRNVPLHPVTCVQRTQWVRQLAHNRHRTPMAVGSPLKSLEHTQECVSMDINIKCFTHLGPQIWPHLSVLPCLGLEGKERTSWPADAPGDAGEACVLEMWRKLACWACLHLHLCCPQSLAGRCLLPQEAPNTSCCFFH